jgi:hypothetical protein
VVNPADDLELEKQADYRLLTLAGNHYELGRQLALLEADQEPTSISPEEVAEVAQMLGLSLEQFAALGTVDQGESAQQTLTSSQMTFAEDCLEIVWNYHPSLVDELEGYASVLGAPVSSLLGQLTFGMEASPRQCSAFAWRGPDGVIVGRNYDFFYWAKTRHLIHSQPEIYYATVGMNDGLIGGRHEGVNERGLFVALSKVIANSPAEVRPGVVFHLVPRILLETCATAREAKMLARDMPHLMSYAYLVADAQEMFVVEAHPDLVRVREAGDGYIAATNHFLDSDLKGLMQSPVQKNSERRLERIELGLAEAPEAGDRWQTVASILAEHEAPMCGHTDGMATLWSMIADLTNQRLAYSLGAPCRNQYQDIPWPGTARDVPATTRE